MDSNSCILVLFTMTTFLLIQLFKEPPLGVSSLEAGLSELLGSQLVALDSFSDGSNLSYVKKMIEGSESITAIVWESDDGMIKGMQPIFNALLKKKQVVSLVTNSSHGVITKLSRVMKSQMVKDEEELMKVIRQ